MEIRASSGFGRRAFLGGVLAAAGGFALGKESKPAPLAKAHNNPFVYQFKIGEFDAWSISDGYMLFRNPLDLMWPREDRSQMRNWLENQGDKTDGLSMDVNILVVRIGRETVIFDAGFGLRDDAKSGWLQDGLRQVGITPEQITAGFLSHSHVDHLQGFINDGKPMFPNAAIHFLPEEHAFWHAPEPDFSQSQRNKAELPSMIAGVRGNFEIIRGVSQAAKAGSGFFNGAVTIEAAPGHTAGHAVFRIKSGNDSLLHLMDLSHHRGFMFHNPNWHIAFDHHPQQSIDTRKKVFARAAAERTRCYGFHLPWPGLGRLLPVDQGYVWHAEQWRWGI